MQIYKRAVIKVGTSTLTHETGNPNLQRIDKLVRVLSDIKSRGIEIILVSSGAIAVGCATLSRVKADLNLPQKQAASSVGQSHLMHIYEKLFSEYTEHVGQVLLSRTDIEHELSRANLLRTFDVLLQWGIIPIVNENDSVFPEEILAEGGVFGDNDTLSASVAGLISADVLVLLSDIDGLFTGDPRKDKTAKPIHRVCEIDDDLKNISGGAGSARGTGGMLSKLAAGEIALEHGFDMFIANGKEPSILYDVFDGKQVGTLFRADFG